MAGIGTIDDLLERAQRGAAAGHALESVKAELTAIRDDVYRKLLNAPPEKVLELRADLKAIEKLAQSLLVKQAQGDVAYQALISKGLARSDKAKKPPILRPARVARQRRPSAKDTTAHERIPSA